MSIRRIVKKHDNEPFGQVGGGRACGLVQDEDEGKEVEVEVEA